MRKERRYPKAPYSQARRPATNASSFAPMIDGRNRRWNGPGEKPQSVPAITFSRPTKRASLTMRSATGFGCSIKFVW